MTNYPEIHIKKLPDGLNYEMVNDCIVDGIIIKAGSKTDLVSVPRLLWLIIPPHGLAVNPSIVHDYLTRNKILPRVECDTIFYELLIKTSINPFQAATMYIYVRLFGWIKYYRKLK